MAVPFFLLWAVLGRPAAWAGDVPFGEGLLWRIQVADAAPDAAPSYLLGTIHITDERVLALPEPVREAFDSARSATFEIIMTPQVQVKMGQAMVLTDGRSLDAILGPETFAKVVEAGRRYGFEPAQLRALKPWALASLLSIPDSEMEIGRASCRERV